MTDPAVEDWMRQHRHDTDAQLRAQVESKVKHSLDYRAALELLDRREKQRQQGREEMEAKRFRLLLWVGVLTLLATLAGVALTLFQIAR
jgi:hypothetical protein